MRPDTPAGRDPVRFPEGPTGTSLDPFLKLLGYTTNPEDAAMNQIPGGGAALSSRQVAKALDSALPIVRSKLGGSADQYTTGQAVTHLRSLSDYIREHATPLMERWKGIGGKAQAEIRPEEIRYGAEQVVFPLHQGRQMPSSVLKLQLEDLREGLDPRVYRPDRLVGPLKSPPLPPMSPQEWRGVSETGWYPWETAALSRHIPGFAPTEMTRFSPGGSKTLFAFEQPRLMMREFAPHETREIVGTREWEHAMKKAWDDIGLWSQDTSLQARYNPKKEITGYKPKNIGYKRTSTGMRPEFFDLGSVSGSPRHSESLLKFLHEVQPQVDYQLAPQGLKLRGLPEP